MTNLPADPVWARFANLKPTQITVGFREVAALRRVNSATGPCASASIVLPYVGQ